VKHRAFLFTVFLSTTLAFVNFRYSKAEDYYNQFNNAEWNKLVHEQEHAVCFKERTSQCLLDEAVKLRIADGTPLNLYHDDGGFGIWGTSDHNLLVAVIDAGDKHLAEALLKLLPAEADQRRMQLLFLTGKYDEAAKLLNLLQKNLHTGGDYGAVRAILKHGDLDKALQIAEMTAAWGPTDKKYLNVMTPICMSGRPLTFEVLSKSFAEKKDYDNALKASSLIIQHWHMWSWRSSCDERDQQDAYSETMIPVMKSLATEGKTDRVKEIWPAFVSARTDMLTGYGISEVKADLIKDGMKEEDLPISKEAEEQETRESGKSYRVLDNLEQQRNYDQAIKEIESWDATKADAGSNSKSLDEQLNNFSSLFYAAIHAGDIPAAGRILDHMEPYLLKRAKDENPDPLYSKNPADFEKFIEFSSMSADAGHIVKGKEFLDLAKKSFDSLKDPSYHHNTFDATVPQSLLIKLGDYDSVTNLAFLAASGRWDKYEKILSEPMVLESLGKDGNVCLADTMFTIKKIEKLMQLVDKLDDHETNYARHNYTNELIKLSYPKNSGVSDAQLENLWLRKLTICPDQVPPTALSRMSACYLDVYQSVHREETKRGTENMSGKPCYLQ
jgi:hypothetical protein